MKRVLIPHTRELCYLSGEFFLDRIQSALEELDVTVDRVDFPTKGADYALLEDYIGTKYDSIHLVQIHQYHYKKSHKH